MLGGLLGRVLRELFRPARKPARRAPRSRHTIPRPVAKPEAHRPPLPPRKQTDPEQPDRTPITRTLHGKCFVIDGDTIVISGTHIRLAGVDAPELEDPWGKKAKSAMITMCKGQVVTAELSEEASYDRIVAKCLLPDGRDLSAEMVKQGLALDWPKFSGGAYRDLEPAGVRKKLWRVAAKHRGRRPVG